MVASPADFHGTPIEIRCGAPRLGEHTEEVLAPADGTVAGSAVTLLDSLVRRWREKTSAREPMHRLLMIVDELPKTRSGKIMRRLLKDVAENREIGDVTTLADSSVMNLIKEGMSAPPKE